MSDELYVRGVLQKYQVGPLTAFAAQAHFRPLVQHWAGQYLSDFSISGSNAKGTAVQGTTDADLLISLAPHTQETLKEIYDSLYAYLDQQRKYSLRKQNVSIGVTFGATSIDLVPAKRQSHQHQYHSLYHAKGGTWTQTNTYLHVTLVKSSGRIHEIRAMKIWRSLRGLDFPSFYLELIVMDALGGRLFNTLLENIVCVLEFIRDNIETRRVTDPANTNNIISNDLTTSEKKKIAVAAAATLAGNWRQFIW